MTVTAEKDRTVLSVERLFLVLEVLAEQARPMTLTEIAMTLELPKSSMLKLLRGMTNLGYLSEDPSTKSYFPSLKICTVSRQIESMLIGHQEHEMMLEDIRNATGESVSLVTQHGIWVEFYNSLPGTHELTFNLDTSIRYPVHTSAAGRMLLTQLNEVELQKLAKRIDRTNADSETPFDLERLKKSLATARKQGFATTDSRLPTNVSSVAVLLPPDATLKPIAVSIGGPKDRIVSNRAEIVSDMMRIVSEYYP